MALISSLLLAFAVGAHGDDAQQAFDQLYGDQIKEVQATQRPIDDVELAVAANELRLRAMFFEGSVVEVTQYRAVVGRLHGEIVVRAGPLLVLLRVAFETFLGFDERRPLCGGRRSGRGITRLAATPEQRATNKIIEDGFHGRIFSGRYNNQADSALNPNLDRNTTRNHGRVAHLTRTRHQCPTRHPAT